MTTAARVPLRRPPAGETIRGADLFASGSYDGDNYSLADLEQVVENFARLKHLVSPPAVIGHEEDQLRLKEILESIGEPNEATRTDEPSAGWVNRVWVDRYFEPATNQTEGILRGDIIGVPPKIAQMIRDGRFRRISAEIYPNFKDDFGRTYGAALRRVSYLGGQPPRVKRTGDIPAPTAFSEPPTRLRTKRTFRADTNTYLCFSERVNMDRAQMMAAIMAAMPALQQPTLDAMSDDQLADLVKNLPAAPAPAPTTTEQPVTMSEMSRDEMIAALTSAGQDAAAVSAMSDDELRAKCGELGLSAMSEKGKAAAATFAERQIRETVARVQKYAADLKKQKVETFTEQMVKDGKILARDRDFYRRSLMRCNDIAAVHAFSEGGAAKKGTELESEIAHLAQYQPIQTFGEKIPTGGDPNGKPAGDKEEKAVRKFAETHATALKAAGYKTPDLYVKAFSEAKVKKPELTAAQFGVPAEFYA